MLEVFWLITHERTIWTADFVWTMVHSWPACLQLYHDGPESVCPGSCWMAWMAPSETPPLSLSLGSAGATAPARGSQLRVLRTPQEWLMSSRPLRLFCLPCFTDVHDVLTVCGQMGCWAEGCALGLLFYFIVCYNQIFRGTLHKSKCQPLTEGVFGSALRSVATDRFLPVL